ncbi:hypothetical protein PAL_GLEAN10008045 [Pteropus alecto]|uniref:Uncharacterized protein n=1 Tax=Pteropus alecto TaxID=9402 RepID=L5KPZ0_PTEAL|nr:hypothetical protein PAL_GLEAN10008045 [Pteropus alecto]
MAVSALGPCLLWRSPREGKVSRLRDEGWFKSGFSPVSQVQSLIAIKAPGHLQQPCGGRLTAGTVTASNSQGMGLREVQQHLREDAALYRQGGAQKPKPQLLHMERPG